LDERHNTEDDASSEQSAAHRPRHAAQVQDADPEGAAARLRHAAADRKDIVSLHILGPKRTAAAFLRRNTHAKRKTQNAETHALGLSRPCTQTFEKIYLYLNR